MEADPKSFAADRSAEVKVLAEGHRDASIVLEWSESLENIAMHLDAAGYPSVSQLKYLQE